MMRGCGGGLTGSGNPFAMAGDVESISPQGSWSVARRGRSGFLWGLDTGVTGTGSGFRGSLTGGGDGRLGGRSVAGSDRILANDMGSAARAGFYRFILH